ncbi:MAG: hypothetical protein Q7W30_04065 [Coriobacteriia bacterium]|nr:hypothetical protein [Coriobacteriia bacterium]
MTARLWSELLYWVVASAAVTGGGFVVAYGAVFALGALLEETSLNTWGCSAGLIGPFYIGYGVLVVVGFAAAVVLRRRMRRAL